MRRIASAAAAIIVAAIFIGCAANATVGVKTAGAPKEQARGMSAPVGVAGPITPSKGPTPATVQVTHSDGTPAAAVTIIATDGEERVYAFATDSHGSAKLNIWSQNIPNWQWKDGERWRRAVPARAYPSDDGAGWRFVLTISPADGGGN